MKKKILYGIFFVSIFLLSTATMVQPARGYEFGVPKEAVGMTGEGEVKIYDEDDNLILKRTGLNQMQVKVIEKHITLDKNMEGPDHKASLNPKEMREWIISIRNIEKAFGTSEKIIPNLGKKNIFFMRRSIHLNKELNPVIYDNLKEIFE